MGEKEGVPEMEGEEGREMEGEKGKEKVDFKEGRGWNTKLQLPENQATTLQERTPIRGHNPDKTQVRSQS